MATYYVILSDMEGNEDWRYPTEIEATDKNDAYKAIAESCPPENIRAVLTADEYRAKTSNKNFQRQQRINGLIKDDNSEMSGKDFMNTMLQAAMASGELEEENTSSNRPIQQEILLSNCSILEFICECTFLSYQVHHHLAPYTRIPIRIFHRNQCGR